jgi:hypothetical protein
VGGGRRMCVLELVPVDEGDSPFAGVLTVERADH